MGLGDAGVVDEERGHADGGADLVCGFGDGGEVGDVAGEEGDERI